MGNLYPFDAADRELTAANNELHRQMEALKSGGGDGTSGGMDARVAKLESDVAHLVKQVDRIDARTEPMPADIAVIKATMAGKGFIVTAVSGGAALVIAVLTVLSKLGILAAG
ncbi:hypothetical protein SAMN02927924_01405 [Sphingobium faniae]|nr:hypothetical protein SAMN02927924_01405 [Sphingobium faniae]